MSDKKMIGKESRKGRLRRILDGAVTVLLVLAAALLVYVMISAAKGDIVNVFGRSVLKVLTGSMEPTILTDDYIIIDRNATSDLREGDIISYYSKDPQIAGMVVTHRIVGILDDGRSLILLCRDLSQHIMLILRVKMIILLVIKVTFQLLIFVHRP